MADSPTITFQNIKLTNPHSIGSVYSNNINIMANENEFRLVFSENILEAPNTEPFQELRANIVISPIQAKALASILANTVATFEQRSGKIAWPPQQP